MSTFVSMFAISAPGWSFAAVVPAAETAKVVLIAGRPSHGPGDHEFNAGCKLLAKCLAEVPGVEPVVVTGGWPKDESVFDGARTVVFFMDGGGGHPIIQGDHLDTIQKLMDKGVGLVCLHYAVEVPKGKPGDKFLDWIGGYYETGFSTNPHWKGDFKSFPDHPVTRAGSPGSPSVTSGTSTYDSARRRRSHTALLTASPTTAETRKEGAPPRHEGPTSTSSKPRGGTKCSPPGRSSGPI